MPSTLSVGTAAGKLRQPPAVGALSDGGSVHHRLHIHDRQNGIRFLVDTGADISLLPKKYAARQVQSTQLQLYAANNAVIRTYGEKLLTVDLGLRRSFKWHFCVADVTSPILGADFLYHFSLTVDLRRRRLHDACTGLEASGRLSTMPYVSVRTVKSGSVFEELLKKFPGLTKPSAPVTSRSHGVYHHIETRE